MSPRGVLGSEVAEGKVLGLGFRVSGSSYPVCVMWLLGVACLPAASKVRCSRGFFLQPFDCVMPVKILHFLFRTSSAETLNHIVLDNNARC